MIETGGERNRMIERGRERNRTIERGRERNRTIELMVSHTPLSHFKCQILQIVVKNFPTAEIKLNMHT